MKQYIATIILFTVFGAGTSDAQELLDTKGAIEIALKNNLDIQIANSDLEVSKNNAHLLNSGFLPTLTGTSSANYGSDFSQENILLNGDVVEFNNIKSTNYRAGLDLSVTLFDGLGRKYNYKSLKETYGITELQVRETIENTILNLFSVYYEVARLTENKVTLKETLQLSKDRLVRAHYQFEYGQGSKLDVLNAEVDVNTDSINLINANLALENTKRDLNLVLNRELETRFDVDTAVRFVSGFNMDDIYADIRENNASLLQAERGLLVNEYDLKSRKGGFLPTVGLTGSYGWNQNVFDPNSIVNFNQLDKANTISGSVVASLTWNIFDGGTTMTNVNNAKVAYQRQQLTIKQTRLQVERDAINAWQSYQNALYVFEAQKKNVTTNANNLGRTEEQFKLGQVTSVEFRQAQTNYLNAILAKNQAKYDAKNAELQVLQISGQLLNVAF